MSEETIEAQEGQLLVWHKPEVQRLAVHLDTRGGGGSPGDCVTQDPGNLSMCA